MVVGAGEGKKKENAHHRGHAHHPELLDGRGAGERLGGFRVATQSIHCASSETAADKDSEGHGEADDAQNA